MQRLLWSTLDDRAGEAVRLRALPLVALVLILTVAVLLGTASVALAGNEGGSTDPDRQDCEQCHGVPATQDTGPHLGYATTSMRCSVCHVVHRAPVPSIMLLPAATIKGTCNTCHDGTGGQGVYGAIAARSLTPQGEHSIDQTNVIPGGSALTGLETTRSFSGVNHTLSCDDCHNPHNADTVNPFRGERFRGGLGLILGYRYPDTAASSKLLKRRPAGAPSSIDEYGSDWCAGCHAGRMSGGAVVNHPVDTRAQNVNSFYFNRVALLASTNLTSTTVVGAMTDGAGFIPTNRAFLMPDPRTPQQTGHAPICQQCHEDSRNVGTLTSAGGDAATYTVTPSDFSVQYPGSDNPRFQNFPHETVNRRMLVETDDNLCLNCHLGNNLP